MPPANLSPLNDREYRKLLLTLTLNSQQLDLLVAITDDRNLQDQLINAYEADLRDQGITPLRARLDPKRPSLRATLEELVAQTPALRNGEPAVVTVLNAGELLGVRLSDEKSEQEKFFFSLQWTREALRNFGFPIVLWLPDAVATRLAQQAPDFWSWRGGVFEFVAEARIPERGGLVPMPNREMGAEEQASPVAIEDLQQQIAQLEQTSPESPLLITLYNNLGEAYASKYNYQQALELYEKALTLSEAKADSTGQARSLRNLGDALRECGRPFQALDYYKQALGKYRELGDRNGELVMLNQFGLASTILGQGDFSNIVSLVVGSAHPTAATVASLKLGSSFLEISQYPQAIDYHQQSLAIAREIGDRRSEAASLANLGVVYYSLGQYQQAIEYQQQSLAIAREIGDRQGEANALGNLGNMYNSLGQYSQAIEYYQQDLSIAREIGDRQGEAASLANLGVVYYSLGQYQQAIEYHQQWLAITREIGDCSGEAVSLFNLGNVLVKLEQKQQAISNYEAAKVIFEVMGQQYNADKCDAVLRDLD